MPEFSYWGLGKKNAPLHREGQLLAGGREILETRTVEVSKDTSFTLAARGARVEPHRPDREHLP